MKKMLKETRIVVSIVFLAMIPVTIAVAIFFPDGGIKKLLVFICVVVQSLAYFWYSLSYIPFGRKLLKKCCKSCIKEATEGKE